MKMKAAIAVVFLFSTSAFAAFVDNGDGTVTDQNTGLVWQSCSVGQTGGGCAATNATDLDWEAAIAACEAGGRRLPNIKELRSIVDTASATSPATYAAYFPVMSGAYWSSTSFSDPAIPGLAWVVDFNDGSIYLTDKVANTAFAHCVDGP